MVRRPRRRADGDPALQPAPLSRVGPLRRALRLQRVTATGSACTSSPTASAVRGLRRSATSSPAALVACELDAICPDDTALHLPRPAGARARRRGRARRATRTEDGPLGFVPDSLMDDPPATKRGLLAACSRLLEELDFSHLLLAHGGPIIGDGREQLQELVDAADALRSRCRNWRRARPPPRRVGSPGDARPRHRRQRLHRRACSARSCCTRGHEVERARAPARLRAAGNARVWPATSATAQRSTRTLASERAGLRRAPRRRDRLAAQRRARSTRSTCEGTERLLDACLALAGGEPASGPRRVRLDRRHRRRARRAAHRGRRRCRCRRPTGAPSRRASAWCSSPGCRPS